LSHDVVEDTDITLKDLGKRVGSEVATIVDGVTERGKVQFRSATE
jgi:GTP diphosphokinase / guanosine-3',5'-bis(diphosphate) 3'-diphosphatase